MGLDAPLHTERWRKWPCAGASRSRLLQICIQVAHTGSCHEGFEWTVFPGRPRLCSAGWSEGLQLHAHGWYAALLNTLLPEPAGREDAARCISSALAPE